MMYGKRKSVWPITRDVWKIMLPRVLFCGGHKPDYPKEKSKEDEGDLKKHFAGEDGVDAAEEDELHWGEGHTSKNS